MKRHLFGDFKAATQTRNCNDRPHLQDGVDDEDAQALRADGFDPDDPVVIAAIDLVRWELSPISDG
jgi:hypothetical protein